MLFFSGPEKTISVNVHHDSSKLAQFGEISDQYPYRKQMIIDVLSENNYMMEDFDAFVGRGGGMDPCPGGTYQVNAKALEHARKNAFHPATLGPILADAFACSCGKKAYMVNPPDMDEFQAVARVTGLKDVFRESRLHALSQKEVGVRAAEKLGKRYEKCNLVIAHIGGGISVAAHRQGRTIDGSDVLNGDCPMAPTRAGQLSPGQVAELCFSGKYTEKDFKSLILKNGGLVNHLNTSDVLEVKEKIQAGDKYAELIYDAMIYQIGKSIGSYAAVLMGKVDAVVITGGIAQDIDLVERLKEMIGYIADVYVFPGEFEMEALALAVLRVVSGDEKLLEYSGEPEWKGYEDYKNVAAKG